MVSSITITRPDDFHLHVRDGDVLKDIVPHTAKQFARALIMPNLKSPIVTTEQALAYKARIFASLGGTPWEKVFQPLMCLYLTDNTSVDEIRKAKASGDIFAVKAYPAGATTNSDSGVTNLLLKCSDVLEVMQELGLPLLVHGEVTDGDVDIFDREKYFIDRVMQPLRQRFPELKIVFEHITTKEAVDYVRGVAGKTGATITPQHLLYNRNAIFKGGVRPHWYCLPILKRETHRQALLEAATSGEPQFFLGTDSAPHAKHTKEQACGCAGCYSALHALELYAEAFDSCGKIDRLNSFAGHFGADFYGLPRNQESITLEKKAWTIPDLVPFAQTELVPLAAGERLSWRIADR